MTQNFSQDQIDVIMGAKRTLINLQIFFKENNIGKETGTKLVDSFLEFAFTGGASVGESVDDSEKICLENEDVQAWLADLEKSVGTLISSCDKLLDDLFSSTEREFPHRPMLREAFLDAMFGSNQYMSDETMDGTSNILACLVITKHQNPGGAVGSLLQVH